MCLKLDHRVLMHHELNLRRHATSVTAYEHIIMSVIIGVKQIKLYMNASKVARTIPRYSLDCVIDIATLCMFTMAMSTIIQSRPCYCKVYTRLNHEQIPIPEYFKKITANC